MRHESISGQPLRFLSVCSGIEAASVAWEPLGWEAVAFGEIDKAASRLLAYHYPDVPNLGDFTKIRPETLGRVDILCGGTPCQAFSVAGARRGLDDERGNLSLEFVRLAHELADGNELRNAIWENVPGVLTMADNAFGCFLAGLVGADSPFVPTERKPIDGKSNRWWRWAAKERVHAPRWPKRGMVSGPKGRAAWGVKDAQYFGLAQRRERVLVVADFGTGADPATVLFERVGVPWNPPARGEAREGVAGTTEDGVGGRSWPADVAPTLNAAFGDKQGLEDQHALSGAGLFVPHAIGVTGEISHTLKAEGADASEDGTGRGTPIVAFDTTTMVAQQVVGTLSCNTGPNGHDAGNFASNQGVDAGYVIPVAQTVAIRGREGGATAELGGEIATALRASQGGGDKPHVLTSAVRRLTPKECERLQGFPDNFTRIPVKWYATKKVTKNRPDDMWEPDPNGGWWLMQADGPRYKQLGNSWAVPKFRWLGFRIMNLMPQNTVSAPAPISGAKIVENNEKILSTKHNKPFTFTPTRKEADMFRIEITAGSPTELVEAIRALAPLAGIIPEPITIDADPAPAPQAVEPAPVATEVKTRKPRAKKEEAASVASSVESAEKPGVAQLDIEQAIADKSVEPVEVGDEQDPAGRIAAAVETAAGEPFTMTRAELKDWLIRGYLVDCIPSQNDRPAAFKALCEENGFKNFTETPDDKLPALKALADQKIKQFKDGGK